MIRRPPRSTLFPYTTPLPISERLRCRPFPGRALGDSSAVARSSPAHPHPPFSRASISAEGGGDRKSTRLNSSHGYISYAVFCLKKKKKHNYEQSTPNLQTCTL